MPSTSILRRLPHRKLKDRLPRAFQRRLIAMLFASAGLGQLLCHHAAAQGLQIAWDAPNDSRVVGYEVHYGESSGNYDTSIDAGADTTYTLTGLEAGKIYYLAARSYDQDKQNFSAFSNELMTSISAPQVVTEIKNVTVGTQWQRVDFEKSFADPIIVAKPLSQSDNDPAVVRIRNVDATGFEIRVQEWDYLDGTHAQETVAYIAMERGSYTLDNGARVEAGRLETSRTHAFEAVTFTKTFNNTPVLLTAVNTVNEDDAVTTRVRNITTTGFEVGMREQEANTQAHATESIAYIAFEPSSGTLDGRTYEVARTSDVVTHDFYTLNFPTPFPEPPLFLADMQTTDGGDTANLRWQNKSASSIEVQVDEEQSNNSEIGHTTEVVGYLVLGPAFGDTDSDGDGLSDADEVQTYGTDPYAADTDGDGLNDGDELDRWGGDYTVDHDADGLANLVDPDSDNDGALDGVEVAGGSDPLDPNSRPEISIEFGQVALAHDWQRVDFATPFLDPIVVAKPLSQSDNHPAVVRIRNVDATGFEIRVQEWDYLDGVHAQETVAYIAMERGSYTLDNGARVEAGRLDTSRTHAFEAVTFTETFNNTPVLLTAVNTVNEDDAVTTRIRNITTAGFEVGMREQEANTQAHATESIAYIAFEPSSGTLDGRTYEVARTSDVVTHDFYTINFPTPFLEAPLFLANMQTTDGGDTANLRWQNSAASSIEIRVDEEKSNDAETGHTTEVVGYVAIENRDTDPSQSVAYQEDFEGYSSGESPQDWLDTAANNSLSEDDSLFQVSDLSGEKVFGTVSTQTNIHSHHVGADVDALSSYEYTGRMLMTDSAGGIGVTFFSQYPTANAYYRLRRFDNYDFLIAPHGTSVSGDIHTDVVPQPNQWYRFRIQVEDTGVRTEIKARVWRDGSGEPSTWQAQAYDDSSTRLTAGAIGVWSYTKGSKFWDDLMVESLVGEP